MKKAILILGFLLMAGNAQAFTANELEEYCSKDDVGWENGVCLGYMRGVMDYHVYFGGIHIFLLKDGDFQAGTPILSGCVPPTVTVEQTRKVFMKFAKEFPERLHEHPFGLLRGAILKAWPCEKNN